jgi:hypothetical protein
LRAPRYQCSACIQGSYPPVWHVTGRGTSVSVSTWWGGSCIPSRQSSRVRRPPFTGHCLPTWRASEAPVCVAPALPRSSICPPWVSYCSRAPAVLNLFLFGSPFAPVLLRSSICPLRVSFRSCAPAVPNLSLVGVLLLPCSCGPQFVPCGSPVAPVFLRS